jgi:hypothetical protein
MSDTPPPDGTPPAPEPGEVTRSVGRAAARRIVRQRSDRLARTPEARRRELAAAGGPQTHGLTISYPTGRRLSAGGVLRSLLADPTPKRT